MEERVDQSTASRSNWTADAVSSRQRVVAWLPVFVWCGMLFLLSTQMFSATNTGAVIEPILRWLWPTATATTISLTHAMLRKTAHFMNYAILFWLMYRGPMAGRPYTALGLCVIYAMLDEGHQMFVPGRTAALYDVALDSSGALFSRFFLMALAGPAIAPAA